MSEQAAAPAAESAPPVAVAAPETKKEVTVDTAAPAEHKPEPSTPRKRRTLSPRPSKPKEDEETESEPEKQSRKRAKTAKMPRKTPGRKKKVVEPEPDDVDLQQEVETKVAALPDDVKARFGQIVWAKMGGYPYWPCIITDPRTLPSYLQESIVKVVDTKYLVFFYVSNNYAPLLFKMIEPWDDTKNPYREGFPEKESKAPKRRKILMEAIELADNEVKLPVLERATGLLKPRPKPTIEKRTEKPAPDSPAPAKRRPGRPLGSKNKKTLEKQAAAAAAAAKKAQKESTRVGTPEDEDTAGPALSKDEIKAKVASRKTPKKKGEEDSGASAKKVAKTPAKHAKSNGAVEIDSKRKKEIELVVPDKTVKSADIREMTEEAAKKKLKSKTKKDKGDYKVGDLGSFASKMARLQAKESARNNDELVGMMKELFDETQMYRSDVERSGLAAIIAILRKSSNPSVGHSASALRKHMMKILDNDTQIVSSSKKDKSGSHHDAAGKASKRRKVENASAAKVDEAAHKPATESTPSSVENSKGNSTKDGASVPPAKAADAKKADAAPKEAKQNKAPDDKKLIKADGDAQKTAKKEGDGQKPTQKAVTSEGEAQEAKVDTEKRSSSPTKVAATKPTEGPVKDTFEAAEHIDQNREIFVELLGVVLEKDGPNRADLAKEIEAAMFERFKESNEEYLNQARIVVFGLEANPKLRERLFSGNLHTLEVAYGDDAFFKATD